MLYSLRRLIVILVLCAISFIGLYFRKVTWRPPLKTPRPLTYYDGSRFLPKMVLSEPCKKLICKHFNLPFTAVLIDEIFLQQLQQNNCDQTNLSFPIKIGIDENTSKSTDIEYEDFEFVYFFNQTDKNYLDFEINSRTRKIIPKNFSFQLIGNLMVPDHVSLFLEFWHRGKFVNCRNMTMNRDKSRVNNLKAVQNFFFEPRRPIPILESVKALSTLQEEMLLFGIFPFLNGGTFLGWYRECSIIPHTTDIDIAILAENWNQGFFDYLWTHNSSFIVKRQMGLVNDSYELTLIPKEGFKTPIDVFIMYKEYTDGKENRWVGGLTTTGTKYKYMYPEYDPWCAADLLGHIFWVSCTPEDKIQKEYGNTWYLDKNSLKYVWNAARNSVENGRFTRKQMETETYNEYKINDVLCLLFF